MTFKEYLSATNRPSTVRTKLSLFKSRIEPNLVEDPNDPLYGPLAPDDADYWIRSAMNNEWMGLNPNTIKSLLYIFKDYCYWKRNMQIGVSHYVHWVMKQKPLSAPKALTKEEAVLLLKECRKESERLFLTILLALHTGLRKGEVFGLHWEDMDFNNSCIWVLRSYNGPTKNGRSRKIPMSESVKKEFLAIKPNNSNGLRLFKLFNPNASLNQVCYRLGIKEITFHGLRHTFSTLALNAGKSIKDVSDVLGHSKVSTTLDMYWSSSREIMEVNGFIPQI